ncbi:MAG: tetratricopeptide repeat-containing sensor histidine kinase, partial [Bacteroidia bacterium]
MKKAYTPSVVLGRSGFSRSRQAVILQAISGRCSSRFRKVMACLLVLTGLQYSYAQQKSIDSIVAVIKHATNDTTIARAYVALTEKMFATNPDTLLPLCNKALAIAEKNLPNANRREKFSYLFTKGAALNNIAYVYYVKGKIKEALDYFNRGLKINEELNVPREIANSLNNIGAIYQQSGEAGKALDYLLRGLKIQEEIGATEGIGYSLNNIAAIYDKQGQMKKALEYSHRSLKQQEKAGNKYGIATCLNNLGALYVKQRNLEKGLDYYNQSLKIREAIGDKQGIATCLHNIGYIYETTEQNEQALDYNFRGMELYQQIGDKRGIANSLHNIGAIYQKQGLIKKTLDYYSEAIEIYEEMGDKRGLANSLNNTSEVLWRQSKPAEAKPYVVRALQNATEGSYVEPIMAAHYNFAKIDSALGDKAGAFEHYKLYILFRDSISNTETRKAALKKQFQHEYEKKEELARLEQDKKEALQQEDLKRQKQISWLAGGTLVLVFITSLLLFNRYRLKQKNILQQQLNRQQKEQASAVMETQEEERKRIAEDLHDSLGHLLSTAKLNLQTLPEKQKQVESSLQLLNQASEEIRNITFNLMPRTLEEGGLIPALSELAAKVTGAGLVKVHLHVHDMEKFGLEK